MTQRDSRSSSTVTRRQFVGGVLSTGVAVALGAGGSLGRLHETAQAADSKVLTMWWFGEQDAKGLSNWVDASVRAFQQSHAGITIQPTLEPPDGVIPRFRTAAAAHQGPDIQYMWGPIWALEEIWAGRVAPLDDYWSKADIQALGPIAGQVQFAGKTYLATWYTNIQGMVYNKILFKKAGLDPENAPRKWNDFLSVCEQLKKSGTTPIGVGAKDGFIGEWLFGFLGRQNADSVKDYIAPVIGKVKYTDPGWSEYWYKIAELRDNGYFNNDANSLELYQGQDLFAQGKVAFTWLVHGQYGKLSQAIGRDNVRIITSPVFGKGKTAGDYSLGGPHGLFIPSFAKNKQSAADLLRSFHTPERVNAVYTSSQAIPTDPSFDTSLITDMNIRAMVSDVKKGAISGANTIVPSRLILDGAQPATQLLLGGQMKPSEAAQRLEDTAALWRRQTPDELQHFEKWYESLG